MYSNLIDPAGALAALTLNMPASPSDGQVVRITITQDITTLTHLGNGNTLSCPFSTTTTAGTTGEWIFYSNTSTWYNVTKSSTSAVALPAGYCDGLILQEHATATSLQVTAGQARNSTNTIDIVLGSTTEVDFTTTGAGGLDAGALAADTLYNVFVIGDSTSTNATSVLASTSLTTPTMPAGYDVRRRIGSARSNSAGTGFLGFLYTSSGVSRWCMYNTARANVRPFSAVAAHATNFTSAQIGGEFTSSRAQLVKYRVEVSPEDANDIMLVIPHGSTVNGTTTALRAHRVGVNTNPNVWTRIADCDMRTDGTDLALQARLHPATASLGSFNLEILGFLDFLDSD